MTPVSEHAGKFSGGPIEGFKQGWAIIPFGHRPHYWQPMKNEAFAATIYKGERVHYFRALCGVEAATYKGVPALAVGDYLNDRCKHCLRVTRKRRLQ